MIVTSGAVKFTLLPEISENFNLTKDSIQVSFIQLKWVCMDSSPKKQQILLTTFLWVFSFVILILVCSSQIGYVKIMFL